MFSKRVIIAGIALAFLALTACGGAGTTSDDPMLMNMGEADDFEKLAKGWTYDNQVDEMRGETTRFASVRAEGWASMAPELYVYKKQKGAPQIAIRGSLDEPASPQMRCGGSLNIKFDDGPVRKVDCQMGMAVLIDPAIIPALRKSKNTWIEIETSIGSEMQYKFNTSKLDI